jgi:DNA-binding response OmpR family regulator
MARVLVVDDDRHDLRALALAMAVDDHALEMLDGPGAASALRSRLDGEVPDVVVLSRDLPDEDGLVVLRELRAHPQWADLPVLVTSQQDSDEAVWEGWAAGASSYVTPPLDAGRLRDLVIEQLVQQTFG